MIYLDVPVAEVRRRIEARNRRGEASSPATSLPYLQSLENAYKHKFLKDIRYRHGIFWLTPAQRVKFCFYSSNHAELLIYDWTEVGDTEILVEDIERLDFDQYTIYDSKMEDWRRVDKWDWNSSRYT